MAVTGNSLPLAGVAAGSNGDIQINSGGRLSAVPNFTRADSTLTQPLPMTFRDEAGTSRLAISSADTALKTNYAIRPLTDSAAAIRFQNAAGTKALLTLDTINAKSFVNEAQLIGSGDIANRGIKIYSQGVGSTAPPMVSFYSTLNDGAGQTSDASNLISILPGTQINSASAHSGFTVHSFKLGQTYMQGCPIANTTTSDLLGTGAYSFASNPLAVVGFGVPAVFTKEVVCGRDRGAATASEDGLIRSGQKSTAVTNSPGSSLTLRAGGGTGDNTTKGTVVIETPDATASGTTAQVYTSKLVVGRTKIEAKRPLNLSNSVPTTPVDGDLWFDGSSLKMRIAGVTRTFTAT